MILFISGRCVISAKILFSAWTTVLWSLPPRYPPTSCKEREVRRRARYIATWRGRETVRVRLFDCNCARGILKKEATVCKISSICTVRPFVERSPSSGSLTSGRERGACPGGYREERKPNMRSSSLILLEVFSARNRVASLERGKSRRRAIRPTIAVRVSGSAGASLACRPHENLETSRASTPGRASGEQPAAKTSCL